MKKQCSGATAFHGIEQIKCVDHIVGEILLRVLHGLAHIGIRGEVYDRCDSVFANHLLQQRTVIQVTLDERPPLYCLTMAVNQVIKGYRRETGIMQRFAGMAADITGTTGNKY